MNKTFLRYSLLVALIYFPVSIFGQTRGFSKIKWEREKIAPGLIWKFSHTIIDDTIPQNINLLFVNIHRRRVSILYNPKQNIITGKLASDAGALGAINAGFFSIKEGGSATYIKVGGKIMDADTAKKWTKNANMTGAVIIDRKRHLLIMEAMMNSWFDSHNEYPDILVTGPLLIHDKKKVNLPETSLVITKHPRSCIGVINRRKIVLVTLDGRTAEAHGMSLTELADLMKSLKCQDAVNLDGGGSTTMWIKDKPYHGVVNMPCDNKKFDHEGERAVSDIIIIK